MSAGAGYRITYVGHATLLIEIGGVRLRKGTWLLAVRILSDELWEQVKGGELTGFSIGGSARRVPEGQAPPEDESAGRRAA